MHPPQLWMRCYARGAASTVLEMVISQKYTCSGELLLAALGRNVRLETFESTYVLLKRSRDIVLRGDSNLKLLAVAQLDHVGPK